MGLIAGVVFIVFELIIAGTIGPGLFGPLRLISAIVLGQPPTIGLASAIIVGLIVHFVLSAVFGLVFGVIAWLGRSVLANRVILIGAATVYGFLLWIVNFYVIVRGIGLFPWFSMPNPVVQFLAHTIFFGTALGLLLSARVGQGEGRAATE